jgi:hypothetical protein
LLDLHSLPAPEQDVVGSMAFFGASGGWAWSGDIVKGAKTAFGLVYDPFVAIEGAGASLDGPLYFRAPVVLRGLLKATWQHGVQSVR